MNTENKKPIRNIFVVLIVLFFLIPAVGAVGVNGRSPLQPKINTPLKAAVFYFPSPSTMRCLNHSNIPRNFRKGIITRKIEIPKQKPIEESVTIGINSRGSHKRFVLSGNLKYDKEIFPIKLKTHPFLSQREKTGEKIPVFFGFEDLLGLQKRIHFKDKIGDQELNYEVFLKMTKGKIGKSKYELSLFGQDKSIDGMVTYFLSGKGKIGNHKITVIGKEIQKDYYEINELYGPIMVFTTIRVYD